MAVLLSDRLLVQVKVDGARNSPSNKITCFLKVFQDIVYAFVLDTAYLS